MEQDGKEFSPISEGKPDSLADITGRSISFMGQSTSAIDWAEYMQDDRNQYLMGMPDDLDPWLLCDVWDIDTACQLITLGCKQDIEKQRAIKKLPVTAPHFHAFRARTICEVYDRAKHIAELSKINDPDTPANWIKWAQSKGYSVAHLMPANAPAEKEEAGTGVSPSIKEIPGKMPKVKIGQLAIKAARQIECGTGKRATAKRVIEMLQSWVDHKDNPKAVTELTEKIPNGVKWVTGAGKENDYDINACQKTLETWNKSRA